MEWNKAQRSEDRRRNIEIVLLSGKVVLVTGGGRGIGAAIARVVGSHGASVAVNYSSSREKAEEVVRQIEKAGGIAQLFAADVRNADAVCRR